MYVANLQSNTFPAIIHAHGSHSHKPHWQPIKERFFASPPRNIGSIQDLTILTCNNGHAAMGVLERSLNHLGVPYVAAGQGVRDWVNSRDKPATIVQCLETIETEFVLYADSRDAICIVDPHEIVRRFRVTFDCALLFGADRINWPPVRAFRLFEERLAAGQQSDFRYLNGGMWIGKTEFCREFFAQAMQTPVLPEAPDSEQGILRRLLPQFVPEVQVDYRCCLFQNIGFVVAPIFAIHEGMPPVS
jgi:hypothetical protein